MFNVICMVKNGYAAITVGREYIVYAFNGDVYCIIDDNGGHSIYPSKLFKNAEKQQPTIYVKPPLGLIPRKIYWEELNYHRRQDIIAAMQRRMEAKMDIPVEWCQELVDLVRECDK
jgi:hypothetical protein